MVYNLPLFSRYKHLYIYFQKDKDTVKHNLPVCVSWIKFHLCHITSLPHTKIHSMNWDALKYIISTWEQIALQDTGPISKGSKKLQLLPGLFFNIKFILLFWNVKELCFPLRIMFELDPWGALPVSTIGNSIWLTCLSC